jgi:hypothetical protein
MRQYFWSFCIVLVGVVSGVAGEKAISARLFLSEDALQVRSLLSSSSEIKIAGMDQDVSGGGSAAQGVRIKSKGKAFLLSLLLPGLGERYVGNRSKSEIFMATEAGLWLACAGFAAYGDWREQDYHAFAATHANADVSGKPRIFFINMGNFQSVYDYNAAQLRERNLPGYYQDVVANYWNWDSGANRDRFEKLRISADKANNRSTFAIGAILANHIVSAIDAVWSAHRHNKAQLSSVNLHLRFGENPLQATAMISIAAFF